MKADPDFHPVAADWLDGTASEGSQRLLAELLHESGAVEEYAALCRMESLMRLRMKPAEKRRAAIAGMIAGPAWPRQVLRFCRRPAIRWYAAAALLMALVVWTLWPAADSATPLPRVVKPAPSTRIVPETGGGRSFPAATAVLLPADRTVEPWLRRFYVKPIPLTGGLTEAAAALAASVQLKDGQPLTVDLHSTGDAPVHLNVHVALPAWTALEILALQSGTELVVSEKRIVFRDAARPLPAGGVQEDAQPGKVVRAAFGQFAESSPGEAMKALAAFSKEALGGALAFAPASKDAITFKGPPRTVRTLTKICGAAPRSPLQLQWTAQAMELPEGQLEAALAECCPGRLSTPNGQFLNDTERQLLLRALSQQKGVNLLTLPIAVTNPGESANWASHPGGEVEGQDTLALTLEGLVNSAGAVSVVILQNSGKWNEATKGWSSQELTTSVSIQSGGTVVLGGLIGEDGRETVYLVGARVVESTGPPREEPAKEELPFGIPVPEKPGFVLSPYAQDKGFVDVGGLAQGTKVKCPYTGQLFRVP